MVRPSLVETALARLPEIPDKTLRLLFGYLRIEQRFDDAERVLAELVDRHGLTGAILDSRADLQETKGDLSAALAIRVGRVSRFPDATGWIRLARLVIDSNLTDRAERLRDIDQELNRVPESDLTIEMAKVEVAFERGRSDDARMRAEALLTAAPRSSRPALFLARIAIENDQLHVARRYLTQAADKFGQRAAQSDVRKIIELLTDLMDTELLVIAESMLVGDRPPSRDILSEDLVALFETVAEPEYEPDELAPLDDPVGADLITAMLRDVWGYDELRPGQAQVIQRCLDGLDTLAIMPTGAGKSLTFQLPALLLDGPVVVVSPLIALMHDQLTTLPEPLKQQSTLINSTLDPAEMDRRLDGISQGKYRLIYAAPERFRQASFLAVLRAANVGLVVIDEAHCVSMWGHDFRPDYFFLTRALEELGDPPTLAVTATATNAMATQIGTSLGRTFQVIRTSAFRENLFYSVERLTVAEEKAKRLVTLCMEAQGAVIVYVSARKHADDLAARLRYHGVQARAYHAGMSTSERTACQNGFLANDVQVIVATIAFGMGINKPDVRMIVHHSPSRSLEAYIQESGRAGRDGLPARCILLYTPGDTATIRRHANEQSVTIEELRGVYRGIKLAAAGRWSILDRQEIANLAGDTTDVNVAIGLLEQANLIRRHPDSGRLMTLRWNQRSAESDVVAPNDRFGQWLARVSTGSAIVTVPTATACDELDCSPAVLERAVIAHHGIAATFQQSSVCLELLPTGIGTKVDMQSMLNRLQSAQKERAEEMIGYLTANGCRHVHLARHLNEKIAPCGDVCDRCAGGTSVMPTRTRFKSSRVGDPYYNALAEWRTQKAREMVVPAFVIASDRLLDSLATARPTSREALRGLSGIGAIKDRDFGAEILSVIQSVGQQS